MSMMMPKFVRWSHSHFVNSDDDSTRRHPDWDQSKSELSQKLHNKSAKIVFWLKIGQTKPLYVYFRPFLKTLTSIVQNLAIKARCDWDSNSGPQHGRH